MAEIAGTAVGIISLSLQICQGLVTYIDGVKHAKSKTEQIAAEMEMLADQLEKLETLISGFNTNQSVESTQKTITACALAIHHVHDKLKDLQANGNMGLRTKFNALIKTLTFPFKESDVTYLKGVVNSIQQSLQIALCTLLLERNRIDSEETNQKILQASQKSQTVLDVQRHNHEESMSLMVRQLESISQISFSNGEEFTALHQNIKNIQQATTSLSVYMPYLEELRDFTSRLTSMRAGLENQISSSRFPVETENDAEQASSHHCLSKRPRRVHKDKLTQSPCACLQRPTSKFSFVNTLFSLSKTQITHHMKNCPWSTADEVSTEINFKTSIRSRRLRKQVFASILIYAGRDFAIKPSLVFRGVVEESSPAFRIIQEGIISRSPANHIIQDLCRAFQAGEASPHDRLSDGSTILHYTICRVESLWRYFRPDSITTGAQLLHQIMSLWRFLVVEIDDYGQSCADYFLQHYFFYGGSAESLGQVLWDHGTPASQRTLLSFIHLLANRNQTRLLPSDLSDVFLDLDECYQAVLTKSEANLSRLLSHFTSDPEWIARHYPNMLSLATCSGWIDGCYQLIENCYRHSGWNHMASTYENRTLLTHSLYSRSPLDMIQFWLKQRERGSESDLVLIGGPEVTLAACVWKADLLPVVPLALIRNITRQRELLQDLLKEYDIKHFCSGAQESLLDAHVACAIEALLERDVDVPPFLRIGTQSIFSQICLQADSVPEYSLKIFDLVYEAGFRSVTGDAFVCNKTLQLSPWMIFITGIQYSIFSKYQFIDWFISKGSRLSECWPGTNTSAFHLLGWGLGKSIQYGFSECEEALRKNLRKIHNSTYDACDCPCNGSGCTFDVMFFKGMEEAGNDRRLTLWRTFTEYLQASYWSREMRKAVRLFESTDSFDIRRLATSLLRFLVFSALGLRHTCCDPNYFQPSKIDDPRRQRYTSKDLIRIREEDAELRSLLEELVPRFDAAYDDFDGDLQAFILTYMVPEMQQVLKNLAAEDKKKYATGRLALGVNMVYIEDSEEDGQCQAQAEGIEEDSDSDEDF